jgi:hypothetical protein
MNILQRLQAAGAYLKDLGQTATHPFQAINYINNSTDNIRRNIPDYNQPSQRFQNAIQRIQERDAQMKQPNFQLQQQQQPQYNLDPNLLERVRNNPQITNAIKQNFGNDAQTAMAVALAESRYNPGVKNIGPNTHAVGLYQFQPGTWQDVSPNKDPNARLDPIASIIAAKNLKDRRGWSQWEAYNNGAYKNFMDYYNKI